MQTMQASAGRTPSRGKTKSKDPEMATGEAMRAPLTGGRGRGSEWKEVTWPAWRGGTDGRSHRPACTEEAGLIV